MIRNIREIHKVKKDNGLYDYYEASCAPKGAMPCAWHTAKTINKVIQADGTTRIAYMYGEKTWSYDKEEIEQYRAEQSKIKAELLRRNKMLKAITAHYETMTTEELEEIVKKGF